MIPTSPVLIVGAGIAGLTAALALSRRGVETRLIERAARLGEVGAGLQLSPNALRVLDALDLLPAVRRRAVEAESVTLKRFADGKSLAKIPVRGEDGLPYLSLLRADLQAALLEAVAADPAIRLDLGRNVVGLERDGRTAILWISDTNGETEELRPEILIAADGVRSAIGEALGKPPALASGNVAWRLMSDEPAPPGTGIRAWLGSGRHAVAYPVDGGRRTNLVVILPQTRADLAAALRNGDPELRYLVESAGPPGQWPLSMVNRIPSSTDPEGLLFIGDAAHAMEPYAAQGAAMAIEDGYVAAHCLAETSNVTSAWQRFAAERRERWEKVRRRVAFHRFVYHLPPPLDRARNAVMALRSGAALSRDLAWLYDWELPKP